MSWNFSETLNQTVIVRYALFSTFFILYVCTLCYVITYSGNNSVLIPAKNSARLEIVNRELSCLVRDLYTSNDTTKSDNKRCFMLAWGVHEVGDIHARNIECTKHLIGNVRANAEDTEPGEEKTHSNYCNRFVMLDRLRGRAGNQMFEVASLIGMAYKYDAIPIINKKSSLLKHFNLPNQITGGRFTMMNAAACVPLKDAGYDNCSKEFASHGNVTMKRYLQSWRIFEDAKDIVRKIFRFEATREIKVRNYLESISKEGYQRVCIHVRRTERSYINYSLQLGYNPAGKDFFERAQQFYINKFSKVHFIVVTDDICWCKKNLKDVEFSPFSDDYDDLALMAMSDHVIISLGTFGWWGAWLSGGITVYYEGFPREGSSLDSITARDDYYPSHWIGIY